MDVEPMQKRYSIYETPKNEVKSIKSKKRVAKMIFSSLHKKIKHGRRKDK